MIYLPQFIWPIFYRDYSEIYGYADHSSFHGNVPINTVFAKLAVVSEEIADGIRQAFLFLSRESGEDWPGPEAYLESAQYLERGHNSEWEEVNSLWRQIKEEALFSTRYFNTKIEAMLRSLFADIHSAKTEKGLGLVRILPAGSRLYRARVALDSAQLRRILLNPTKELGPPPAAMAKPGRMNASGIALFYGALESETCLTEVRPPVGSQVVIGGFALRRSIRLLNLTLSDEIELMVDPFSENYEKVRLRWAFLRSLGVRLSEPVMPGAEAIDYIPTQLVCEFIAQFLDPKFDRIIYPSSQSSNFGHNVVMFYESSAVQQWDDLLRLNLSASTAEDDETLNTYIISPIDLDVISRSEWTVSACLPPTLALLKSTIIVAGVNAINYETRIIKTNYSKVRKPTTIRSRR